MMKLVILGLLIVLVSSIAVLAVEADSEEKSFSFQDFMQKILSLLRRDKVYTFSLVGEQVIGPTNADHINDAIDSLEYNDSEEDNITEQLINTSSCTDNETNCNNVTILVEACDNSSCVQAKCLDFDGDGFAVFIGNASNQTKDLCGIIDCNDNNQFVHPGAQETCNEVDDNCNGEVDEGLTIEEIKLSYTSIHSGTLIHFNGQDSFEESNIDFFHGWISNQRDEWQGSGGLNLRTKDSSEEKLNLKFDHQKTTKHSCMFLNWESKAKGTHWVKGIGTKAVELDLKISYNLLTKEINADGSGDIDFEIISIPDQYDSK